MKADPITTRLWASASSRRNSFISLSAHGLPLTVLIFFEAHSARPGIALRILIHGINFSPELTGIGKYSGEMGEWLAAQGHEVRVMTAPPYCPQWRVADPNRWR